MFLNRKLDNGLEVIAECNDQAYSAAVGFFVRTGARDETEDVAGVSHFLEHMVFKGTPTRSADDVNRQFDEMGAHYNAFTTEENTVYYASILPEHLGLAVELLADIMRPSLRDEDFDTEKQVILEEIRMYDDQPPYGSDEKCKKAFFGPHPLGHNVLGSIESVGGLPVESMRRYFQHRYSPGNITLAASGRVDFEALVQMAQRFCGAWQPQATQRRLDPVTPHAGFECVEKASAAQEYGIELAAGPAADDPRRYAAKVVSTILGDDTGSRLYWELVDPGLAEHASLGHYDYQGAGVYMTYLSCSPDDIEENLERVLAVYRQAEAEGFDADELARAKQKINSRVVLSSERPRGRLFAVGLNWVQRQRYFSVAEELDAVARVTLDDLAGVLAAFPLTRNMTLAVGPRPQVRQPVGAPSGAR